MTADERAESEQCEREAADERSPAPLNPKPMTVRYGRRDYDLHPELGCIVLDGALVFWPLRGRTGGFIEKNFQATKEADNGYGPTPEDAVMALRHARGPVEHEDGWQTLLVGSGASQRYQCRGTRGETGDGRTAARAIERAKATGLPPGSMDGPHDGNEEVEP